MAKIELMPPRKAPSPISCRVWRLDDGPDKPATQNTLARRRFQFLPRRQMPVGHIHGDAQSQGADRLSSHASGVVMEAMPPLLPT